MTQTRTRGTAVERVMETAISRRTLMALTASSAAAIGIGASIPQVSARQDQAPTRGGTITAAVVGPVTSLDPLTSLLGSGDGVSYQALYNSLADVLPTGELDLELAKEWTVSDDGLTYTFSLETGITFHDGTPLNAEAIKFNLERYMAEGSTYSTADRLRVMSSIEAPSEDTLVITLEAPNASFLTTVAGCPIVSPSAVEELGEDFQLQGVGSGPFVFGSWTPGSSATFVRNENYWEIAPDGSPFPYIDELVIEGAPDDSVRMLNLRSGEFQLNERLNPLDASQIGSQPGVVLVETPFATSYLAAMNVTKAPFDNAVLRQAVSAALDRAAIIENISYGTGYVAPMSFSNTTWFFIEEPSPVFDVELAAAKLAEAGFPDGIDITLSIINRPVDSQIAQIVKSQLDAVNIRTTIEVLERTTWVELWSAREGEMGILQRGAATIDPDNESPFFSNTNVANFAGYDSPAIRELIEQANLTTDQEERKALWEQIVGIMVEDAAYVFMGNVPAPGAAREEVQDIDVISGSAWRLNGTWLSE